MMSWNPRFLAFTLLCNATSSSSVVLSLKEEDAVLKLLGMSRHCLHMHIHPDGPFPSTSLLSAILEWDIFNTCMLSVLHSNCLTPSQPSKTSAIQADIGPTSLFCRQAHISHLRCAYDPRISFSLNASRVYSSVISRLYYIVGELIWIWKNGWGWIWVRGCVLLSFISPFLFLRTAPTLLSPISSTNICVHFFYG